MSASLKFVLGLLAAAVALAIGAGAVITRQSIRQGTEMAEGLTGGDTVAGKVAMRRFGCGGCHAIPGIVEATGAVGPSLAGLAERSQLAGRLANTPSNLIRWIRDPQEVAPGNGMPNLGVGEKDARNMAAYVYTLRKMPSNP